MNTKIPLNPILDSDVSYLWRQELIKQSIKFYLKLLNFQNVKFYFSENQ